MNLRDLRYLVAVADHRHFGRAAEACFVSQPTLSTQIKKLERELGVELIERNPGQIMLTAAGEQVVERARIVLGEADDIVEHRPPGQGPRVRQPAHRAVPDARARTCSPTSCPTCTPASRSSSCCSSRRRPRSCHQRLRDGQLDVGVLALPVDDDQLHAEPLFAEDFVLAVPRRPPARRACPGRSTRRCSPARTCCCSRRATACATRRWPSASSPAPPSAPASGPPASRRCARWWPPAWASPCCPSSPCAPPVPPSRRHRAAAVRRAGAPPADRHVLAPHVGLPRPAARAGRGRAGRRAAAGGGRRRGRTDRATAW